MMEKPKLPPSDATNPRWDSTATATGTRFSREMFNKMVQAVYDAPTDSPREFPRSASMWRFSR